MLYSHESLQQPCIFSRQDCYFISWVENRTDVGILLLQTLKWRTYKILKKESIFYLMAIKGWVQFKRAVPRGGRAINCLHFKLNMNVGSGLWIRKQWVYVLYVYVAVRAWDFVRMFPHMFVVVYAPFRDLESEAVVLLGEQLGDTLQVVVNRTTLWNAKLQTLWWINLNPICMESLMSNYIHTDRVQGN